MSQENTTPELTLHDLMLVVNIINLSVTREKFTETENDEVTALSTRVQNFIDAKKAEVENQLNSEEA